VVQRLHAPQRRGRNARRADRYPLIVEVTRDVHRAAVVRVGEPGRLGIGAAIAVPAAVRVPVDLHYQVTRAVVVERGIEIEPEPHARRGRDICRARVVNLDGRVAVVVGREIVSESRTARVATPQIEIVISTGAARVRIPFPSRDGPRRNGVGRKNQSLAPYGIDASTSPERVRRVRTRAADRNCNGQGRTGDEHTRTPYERRLHGNASL